MKQKLRKHWYKIETFYCPMCGGAKEYRTRMFTPKPKRMSKRRTLVERYDWCDA